jgi:hypothetical protein
MFDFERSTSRVVSGTSGTPSYLVLIAVLLFLARVTAAQVVPTAGQLQVNGEIAIVFTTDTVSCSGLSPGDTVSLAGFMIDRQTAFHTVSTPMVSQVADANGSFSATIAEGIKPRSIWLLIDQTTGAYAVAEPEGSVLTRIPDGAVTITGGSEIVEGSDPTVVATINRAHTHAICINDGMQGLGGLTRRHLHALDTYPPGYSMIDAKDGSAADSDGTIDGVVHLNLSPSFLDPNQNSACLFVVDDRTLEYSVTYVRFIHNNPGDCHDPRGCY